MILDWTCPFCHEKHLTKLDDSNKQKNILYIKCTNCNKENVFNITNKYISLTGYFQNDNSKKNYSFKIY